MAGEGRAVTEPGQHRKSHVDAGLRVDAAGQRRHLRRRPAAEQAHRCGGIGPHIEQAAAAQLAMVAEISRWQWRNDELGLDMGERPLLRDEAAERLKLRVMAEYGRLGKQPLPAPRFRDRAIGGITCHHRRLVDDDMLAGGKRGHRPLLMHGIRQRQIDDIRAAFAQGTLIVGEEAALLRPGCRRRAASARDRNLADRGNRAGCGNHPPLGDRGKSEDQQAHWTGRPEG